MQIRSQLGGKLIHSVRIHSSYPKWSRSRSHLIDREEIQQRMYVLVVRYSNTRIDMLTLPSSTKFTPLLPVCSVEPARIQLPQCSTIQLPL